MSFPCTEVGFSVSSGLGLVMRNGVRGGARGGGGWERLPWRRELLAGGLGWGGAAAIVGTAVSVRVTSPTLVKSLRPREGQGLAEATQRIAGTTT